MRPRHPAQPRIEFVLGVRLQFIQPRQHPPSQLRFRRRLSEGFFPLFHELMDCDSEFGPGSDVEDVAELPLRRAVAGDLQEILYFMRAVCHSLARIVGQSSQSRPCGSMNMAQLVSG